MKNHLQRQPDGSGWLNKVPQVTLSFWIIKLLSTTVGETGADFLAASVGWGQGVTTILMLILLSSLLWRQLHSRRYIPWLYWLCVVLVSVVGTQLTDLLTDKLGVSLYLSSAMFSGLLALIFIAWYRLEHGLSISEILSPRREYFYWAVILCSFALGTATGDLATEALGLGFLPGCLVFGIAIGLVCLAWRAGMNPVLSFWLAYILTRPLGAALGDLLTQASMYGGLGLGAMWTSALFLSVITVLVGIAQSRMLKPMTGATE